MCFYVYVLQSMIMMMCMDTVLKMTTAFHQQMVSKYTKLHRYLSNS
jgi:hypothetical protein